jgi:hypothetical protein
LNHASVVDVRRVTDRAARRAWLSVPKTVFAAEPSWVRPLDVVEKERISPTRNPFYAFGEAAFFVAYKSGQPVGRISAQVNRSHLQKYCDQTGHFGFFDCIDDPAVAAALVDSAARWLTERGLRSMCGPFNLTMNQDAGLLVSGFEHRPAIMTSHAGPWSGASLEACGLTKVMDLFAYRMKPSVAPDKLQRLAALARASGRVTVRNIDLSRYRAEAQVIFDIFNDAWSDNWGFVPILNAEAAALARDLRPIMRSKFGWVVEIDGEAAAMMVVLPDLNEIIAPFDGRLLPFNWAKLAYAIWRDDWRTARVPLLGIRKKYRATPLAAGVLSILVAAIMELGRQYQIEWIEFSWILETNAAMVAVAELAAGKPAKVYRIYEKCIKT